MEGCLETLYCLFKYASVANGLSSLDLIGLLDNLLLRYQREVFDHANALTRKKQDVDGLYVVEERLYTSEDICSFHDDVLEAQHRFQSDQWDGDSCCLLDRNWEPLPVQKWSKAIREYHLSMLAVMHGIVPYLAHKLQSGMPTALDGSTPLLHCAIEQLESYKWNQDPEMNDRLLELLELLLASKADLNRQYLQQTSLQFLRNKWLSLFMERRDPPPDYVLHAGYRGLLLLMAASPDLEALLEPDSPDSPDPFLCQVAEVPTDRFSLMPLTGSRLQCE